jgi:hypothetical protein
MSTTIKKCAACERLHHISATCCASCHCDEFTAFEAPLTGIGGRPPQIVACKSCGSTFDYRFDPTCPECDRLYVPDASELLPPRTAAQREAIAHAERLRTQFQTQERMIAEAQLTTTKVYRPLPVWRQRLNTIARGIRTWVTEIRGRKGRTR